jgi:hypothetical protein
LRGLIIILLNFNEKIWITYCGVPFVVPQDLKLVLVLVSLLGLIFWLMPALVTQSLGETSVFCSVVKCAG